MPKILDIRSPNEKQRDIVSRTKKILHNTNVGTTRNGSPMGKNNGSPKRDQTPDILSSESDNSI